MKTRSSIIESQLLLCCISNNVACFATDRATISVSACKLAGRHSNVLGARDSGSVHAERCLIGGQDSPSIWLGGNGSATVSDSQITTVTGNAMRIVGDTHARLERCELSSTTHPAVSIEDNSRLTAASCNVISSNNALTVAGHAVVSVTGGHFTSAKSPAIGLLGNATGQINSATIVGTEEGALERGLVDHLGGFSVALARVRALAGIDEDARVQLRYYPAAESPFEAFGSLFGASAEGVEALVRVNAALSDPRMQRVMAAMREEDANVRAEADRFTVE